MIKADPVSGSAFFAKGDEFMKLPKLHEETGRYCFMECPLGVLKIAEDDGGISQIVLVKEKEEDHMEDSRYLAQAKKELAEYFEGKRNRFDLPLSLHGTEFQKRVWQALCQIPYGETRSYQQLAASIGNKNAQRAVGMANHANKIAIVIPCHRVIQSDGKPGGYAYGVSCKEYLLDLERGQNI